MNNRINQIFCAAGQILTVLAVVFAIPSVAVSQTQASQDEQLSGWYSSIGAGALFFEADEEFNSSGLIEARLGHELTDQISLEGSIGYLPFLDAHSHTSNDPKAWHLNTSTAFRSSLDLLYHFDDNKEVGHFRPHASATGGVMYYENTLADGGHFDPFAGGGLGFSYAFSERWGARGDYQLLVALDDEEINHYTGLSLRYYWGKRSAKSSSHDELSGDDDLEGSSGLKTIYFDFDEAILTPDAKRRLAANAAWLQENPKVKVVVEGHCDERGTTEYNYALGERRAQAAYSYLRSLGVSEDRMQTLSYGEDRPADPRSNPQAWTKNRRVVCVEQ